MLTFPPRKTLAVDVDGTLVNAAGEADAGVVAFVERARAAGCACILWSARGAEHARASAERLGVAHLFHHILSKPDCVIDDRGWSWTRHSPPLHPSRLPETVWKPAGQS